MFDGRKSSTQTGTQPISGSNYPGSPQADLAHQALDATLGQAQAASPGPSAAQQQIVFNTKTFTVSGVAGLNGTTFSNGVTGPASIVSTCGLCHDAPNIGDHSVGAPLNIGVADPPGGNNVLDTSYLPVITICQKPHPARTGGPCALLPQRQRAHAERRGAVLRLALPHRLHGAGKIGPGSIPALALSELPAPALPAVNPDSRTPAASETRGSRRRRSFLRTNARR